MKFRPAANERYTLHNREYDTVVISKSDYCNYILICLIFVNVPSHFTLHVNTKL